VEEGVDQKASAEILERATSGLPFLCSITVVNTIFVALETTEHTSFDLILVSATMRDGIDGVDMCRILQTVGANTPMVLMVEHGDIPSEEEVLARTKFTAVLKNPFSPFTFSRVIQTVILGEGATGPAPAPAVAAPPAPHAAAAAAAGAAAASTAGTSDLHEAFLEAVVSEAAASDGGGGGAGIMEALSTDMNSFNTGSSSSSSCSAFFVLQKGAALLLPPLPPPSTAARARGSEISTVAARRAKFPMWWMLNSKMRCGTYST
jgi:CheY-like chemotaxis protein